MKGFILCLIFIMNTDIVQAQNTVLDSFSYSSLNRQRLTTNQTGMTVLGAWAAANIVTGTAGYFIAKDEEWKAFHGMNAIWNVVNGVIALGGYAGVLKERNRQIDRITGLHRYEANKRLFLINAGLDVLYLGTGIYLTEHAKTEQHPAVWNGFGKSIAMQGAFLLLFDSIMYASHQSRDKQWYRMVSGLSVTGNGIGWSYTLN